MWLFLALVAVPIIEIALFIQVGGAIGLFPTLALVLLTAVAGTLLLRAQGILAMRNLQRSFGELRDPTEPLAHGAMILVAAVLLLTPGFFTDTLGMSLLFAPVRRAVFKFLRVRMRVTSFTTSEMRHPTDPAPRDDVIDAAYTEVEIDPEMPPRPTHRP